MQKLENRIEHRWDHQQYPSGHHDFYIKNSKKNCAFPTQGYSRNVAPPGNAELVYIMFK